MSNSAPVQPIILVADDDPVSNRLICRSLESGDHRIVVARDGLEAQDLFLKNRPDLIISDWMMPKADGMELLRFVRDHHTVSDPYFILLTVKWRSEDRVAGLDSGADDYLIKPFEAEELRARVRAGLRVLSLRRSLERTVKELEEKAKVLEEDLRAAARAQGDLLPKNIPALSGIRFSYRFVPCHFVSGDSLNVFRLSEDTVGFYMLDVCGHGVQAVMHSVSIHRILTPDLNLNSPLKRPLPEAPFFRICSPAEVIGNLNTDTCLNPVTEFFTFFYAVLNHRTRELTYCRAGHLPPLVLHRDGTCALLTEGGMPIGIEPEAAWSEGRMVLAPGDRLLIYSDGVVEVRDGPLQLGIEGLQAYLAEHHTDALEQLLDGIAARAQDFARGAPFPDDFSLLGLEVGPT